MKVTLVLASGGLVVVKTSGRPHICLATLYDPQQFPLTLPLFKKAFFHRLFAVDVEHSLHPTRIKHEIGSNKNSLPFSKHFDRFGTCARTHTHTRTTKLK